MILRFSNRLLIAGLLWSAFFIALPEPVDAGVIFQRPMYIGLGNGLVGYWSFNGKDVARNASGTITAFDRSGSGKHATGTPLGRQTYSSAGASFTYVVPGGVTSIGVKAWGGGGGAGGNGQQLAGNGGGGGFVTGAISVTPGESLTVRVGGGGGGGSGAIDEEGGGGGGGGYSGVLRGSDQLVIAGGGGGGGGDPSTDSGVPWGGGVGGGNTGGDGEDGATATGGGGGTQSAGGSAGTTGGTAGSSLTGGDGASGGLGEAGGAGGTNGGAAGGESYGGGGGAGGHFGGGGGGRDTGEPGTAGGGGGSSFATSTATATSTSSGSFRDAGNNSDADYAGSAGLGGFRSGATGGTGGAGNPGRVVISTPLPADPPVTPGRLAQALDFDGSGDNLVAGNVGSAIRTISFWMKADDTTSVTIMDLDGMDKIELNAGGNVVGTSFPSPTIYVDGVVASAITNNWHHVVIIDPAGASATNTRIGATTFDGKLDEVRFYNRAITADEVKRHYKMGATTKLGLANNAGLEKGLVGYWSFDGKDVVSDLSGRMTAFDRSGNNNNGSSTQNSVPSRTPGRIGQALDFNGTDNQLDLLAVSGLKPQLPVSISAWIHGNGIIANDATLNEYDGVWIEFLTDASQAIRICYGDGISIAVTSRRCKDYSPKFDKFAAWHHVIAVWRGATDMDIYLDGVDVGGTYSGTGGALAYGSSPGSIGMRDFLVTSGGQRFATGTVDEVRIYDRSLSADEVKRLYNNGATAKLGVTNDSGSLKDGLVGYWSFNGKDSAWDGSKLTLYDLSGQGNHGTSTGAFLANKTIGRIGQGLSFDGIDDHVKIPTTGLLNVQGNTAITVSAWLKTRTAETLDTVVMWEDLTDGDSTEPVRLSVVDGSSVETWKGAFGVVTNVTSGSAVAITEFPDDSPWVHLAGVYDGTIIYIYVNGILENSAALTGGINQTPPNSSAKWIIGRGELDLGTRLINGSIDDVRIYNRALSADEVKRLYNNGR